MLALALSLLISFLSGFFLVWMLWPARRERGQDVLMKLSLSVGIGLGFSACAFFIVLLLEGPRRTVLMVVDLVLLLVLAAAFVCVLLVKRGSDGAAVRSEATARGKLTTFLLAAFLLLLAAGVPTFTLNSILNPHGGWDAWAFWNLRAKYLVEPDEHDWRLAFDRTMMEFHNSYPPLLPFTVARCWKWAESETTLAPILVAALFTLGTLGLVVPALYLLSGPARAFAAGIVLLGTPFFITHSTAQYAEYPLMYFFTATVILMTLQDVYPENSYGLLSLAGVTCGLAAFTKNEGLLFLLVAGAVWTWMNVVKGDRKTRFRKLGAFAAGLAPVLLLVIYYRTMLAPGISVLANQGLATALKKILVPSRYVEITTAFANQFFTVHLWSVFWWVLPFYLLVVGVQIADRVARSVRTGLGIVGLVLVGHFSAYLISAYDLTWHLSRSLDRLLLQVWPILLFVFFLVLRSPEEAGAEEKGSKRASVH